MWQKICKIFDKNKKNSKSYLTLIKHVKDRKGHDRVYSLSSNKFKNLKIQRKTKFDEGLNYTINFYKKS